MTPKRKQQRDNEFERQPTEKARACHALASLAECHRDTRDIPKAQAHLIKEFNDHATSLTGQKTTYSRPVALHRSTSLMYRSGAVVSGIGDTGLWIFSGKVFFGLSAGFSTAIAFGLAVIVHVIISSRRSHEPLKSRIRLMKRIALIAFSSFALNFAAFLLATRLPYKIGLLFVPFVPLMAMVMSLGLLVLTAALWQLATLYGTFHAINREYNRLDEELLLTRFTFIPHFMGQVNDNGGPPPPDTWDDPPNGNPPQPSQLSEGHPNPPQDNRRQIAAKTGLSIILAVALTNAACEPPPPPPPLGPAVYVDIVRDVSESTAETDRQTLERSIYNQLPSIVSKTKADKLRVMCFSHDAGKAKQIFEMDLPVAPYVRDFEPELSPEAGQVKKFVEDAEADAKEKYSQAFSDYEQRVKETLKPVFFEQIFRSVQDKGGCSDINGIIHRTVSDASPSSRHYVLIMSDGAQSCPAAKEFEPVITQPEYARILFLIMPLKTEHSGTSRAGMNQRKETLKAAFPWMRTLDYYSTASLAEELTTDTTR